MWQGMYPFGAKHLNRLPGLLCAASLFLSGAPALAKVQGDSGTPYPLSYSIDEIKSRGWPPLPSQFAAMLNEWIATFGNDQKLFEEFGVGIFYARSCNAGTDPKFAQSLLSEVLAVTTTPPENAKNVDEYDFRAKQYMSWMRRGIADASTRGCAAIAADIDNAHKWPSEKTIRSLTIHDFNDLYAGIFAFSGQSVDSRYSPYLARGKYDPDFIKRSEALTWLGSESAALPGIEKKPPLPKEEVAESALSLLLEDGVSREEIDACIAAMVANEPIKKRFKARAVWAGASSESGRFYVSVAKQESGFADDWRYHGTETGSGKIEGPTYYSVCWLSQSKPLAVEYYSRSPKSPLKGYSSVILDR